MNGRRTNLLVTLIALGVLAAVVFTVVGEVGRRFRDIGAALAPRPTSYAAAVELEAAP